MLQSILRRVKKKITLCTCASLADGIHKYPCLFSASSLSVSEKLGALCTTLSFVGKEKPSCCTGVHQLIGFVILFFPGESLLFSPDLELKEVGEEDGTSQRIRSLKSDGWLNVACGWLNPDRHLF